MTNHPSGWAAAPLALKILSVVMLVWAFGAAMNVSNLMQNGLPFFGVFIYGFWAFLTVLFFDFIGPLVFLFALWHRLSWGPKWAAFYIGLFVLNGVVALVTVSAELGFFQILFPNIANLIFLAVIYWKRDCFRS